MIPGSAIDILFALLSPEGLDDGDEHVRAEPQGTIAIADRELPVRAVQTRSERLKDAVDQAYLAKYRTPSAQKYARDLCQPKSRDTTTELVPL